VPGVIRVADGRFHFHPITWTPDLTTAVTLIPGRRISRDFTTWSVPISQVHAVRDTAHAHGLTPVGMARILFHQAPEPPTVRHNGKTYELRFDYRDQALVAAAAATGARWFEPAHAWVGTSGTRIMAWAGLAGAEVTPAALAAWEKDRDRDRRIAMSAAADTDWHPTQPLGLDLYPEQRAGVQYVLEVAGGRCIIGDEPGVGKTAQALAIIGELQAFPATIIVPGSLKMNWQIEAARMLPGRTIEILRGRKPADRLLWPDIIILNYDILQAWLPYLPTPAAVVGDEFHMIKNPGTQRTKATIACMEKSTGPRLGLTGTTVLNDPLEVQAQLEAIGVLEEYAGKKFAGTYRALPLKLNADLRARHYVRRLKKDVWKDAPDRRWIPVYVEGDPTIMEEYRRAEHNIIEHIQEKARNAALKSGATAGEAWARAQEAGLRASAAEFLVAITHLKQLAARAKLEACVDFAKTFLQTGEKLGVYAWHTTIVDTLAEQLHGAVKVQGGMTDIAKDTAVRAFQTKADVRVFVGQIATAGLGLTLTAASKAMILEQTWNPGTMDQVLDRHHRRGQEHDVIGWLMLIQDTIDSDIYDLIKTKRKIVDQTTDGFERTEEEGGTVLGDLLVRLLNRK
jgi:SWI/SNF-related matrix-associated actin-dependent regulator of chromatin subfamily A-like protein 1